MTTSHKFCSKRQAMFRGISKPIFSIFHPGLPSPLNAYYTPFSRPGGGLKRKKEPRLPLPKSEQQPWYKIKKPPIPIK